MVDIAETEQPTTRPRTAFDAVIFDMDGVVTDTAGVHALAWKQTFDGLMPLLAAEHPGADVRAFDIDHDYRTHIDGRSREDGVRAFLTSRGVHLPHERSDAADQSPPGTTVGDWAGHADRVPRSIEEVAALKQSAFDRVLREQGSRAHDDALALLEQLGQEGVPVALVTSSRNAPAVLRGAGLGERFAVLVDGNELARLRLPGKPDPAMFLEAAARLGVAPARTVVFEDAESGVRAANDGGFGLVVGVARNGQGNRLLAAGADVAVGEVTGIDLSDPPVAAVEPGVPPGSAGPWVLRYEGYDAAAEGQREALCTLGNGYWATRGAAPEATADGLHYPGTYLAGVYNRVLTHLPGRTVEDEHLVNAPNWLPLHVRVRDSDSDWVHPAHPGVSDYVQELDLRGGILHRTMRVTDRQGRVMRITSRRFVSQQLHHVGCLITTIRAENFSGTITVRSGLDGRVTNRNVEEYTLLEDHHLVDVHARALDPSHLLLDCRTSQSAVTISVAARTIVDVDGVAVPNPPRVDDGAGQIAHEFDVHVEAGETVTVEKLAVIGTSRDRAVAHPTHAVEAWLRRLPPTAELEARHREAWAQLWREFEVEIEGDEAHALALNLNTFHVLQTVAAADPDLDAGVPARGLHGEAYRGHIFWDEMFVYPMVTTRRPDLSRALLGYRHRRLAEARAAAASAGHAGAMFPWQSGIDGREVTPTRLYNLRNAQWMPDHSHLQRHVGLAIAYGVWQYVETTNDLEFLLDRGLELLVEVSRFFASIAEHDPVDDRFDIDGVMGPDEFHDAYPGARHPGLRNNAYTNVLTSWVLRRTIDAVEAVELRRYHPVWARLGITEAERERWLHIARRLRVPFHADGVISQFEGYESLREFDWDAYRARYGRIGRLDLILHAEGDSTNNYRLSKQPDTLMLFYLFAAEEVRELLADMGYAFPPEALVRTVQFYTPRSSHGSSLSNVVHSWVEARGNRPESWRFLTQALASDIADIQGGTTREGVHLGAMAGSVDMLVRCYTGLVLRRDAIWFNPLLPNELSRVRFRLYYRRQPISVDITPRRLRLTLDASDADPVVVRTPRTTAVLAAGETRDFRLRDEA